jgi:hypothetical protein
MAVCDCCRRDKPDVKIRVGLRGIDSQGNSTANPFHGPLCNDCLARTDRFGSGEQRWLFQKIVQKGRGGQNVPKPAVAARRGEVVPIRPARSKPVDPRR